MGNLRQFEEYFFMATALKKLDRFIKTILFVKNGHAFLSVSLKMVGSIQTSEASGTGGRSCGVDPSLIDSGTGKRALKLIKYDQLGKLSQKSSDYKVN